MGGGGGGGGGGTCPLCHYLDPPLICGMHGAMFSIVQLNKLYTKLLFVFSKYLYNFGSI